MNIEKISDFIPEINKYSEQSFISIKEYRPLNSWKIGGELTLKGDYCGKFLCIIERPCPYCNENDTIYHSIELCYWNDGAMRFQDSENNWVKVTHWLQIPEIPIHNIINISRDEMDFKIECGILKLVSFRGVEDRKKDLNISAGMYKNFKKTALHNISYDLNVFHSSIKIDNIEDYMYCIEIL